MSPQRRKLPPCFECGKHMQGNHHKYLESKMDGHRRIFHKQCALEVLKREPELWKEIDK